MHLNIHFILLKLGFLMASINILLLPLPVVQSWIENLVNYSMNSALGKLLFSHNVVKLFLKYISSA